LSQMQGSHGAIINDRDGPPLVCVLCLDGQSGASLAESNLGRSLASQTMGRWKLVGIDVQPGHIPRCSDLDRAIAAARTPYILPACKDAVLDPTFLEKTFWFLATHPNYAFVSTHELRIDARGDALLHTRAFFDRDGVVRSDQLGLHILMRTRDVLDVGGFSNRSSQDSDTQKVDVAAWDFWLRAASMDRWGSTIAETLIERPSGPALGDITPDARAAFEQAARRRYPKIFEGHQPAIVPRLTHPFEPTLPEAPAAWKVRSTRGGDAPFPARVLMLIPWLRMGGADKFNLDLARSLREKGCELSIATTAPSRDEWHGLFHELTRDIFRPHLMLHWADYPILLRSLIESRRPDVVLISNSELSYHLLPYFRSFCPEPLYIDYVHMEEENWKSGGHARHSAGMNDQLDLSLVTSEHLKSWMVGRGADPCRIDVCPIGVDQAQWKPDGELRRGIRAELAIADDQTLILHAGRICEQKQPKVLARTIQQLSESGRSFTMLIAGDGEDLPWLERFIESHGLSRHVRFLGSTTPSRIRELMAASDLFFLPSAWEGVALVLYEAMASGVVFVGAKVGGQGEVGIDGTAVLIDPVAGELPQDQARRYVREILDLIDHPSRRLEIPRRARDRIERSYTHDGMIQSFLASLEKARLLQKHEPRQKLSPGLGQEMAARAIEYIRLEWQVSLHWREAEYWKAAANKVAPIEAKAQEVRTGRGALRRVMRALRGRDD
jgi:glycosyltransferase involved in cell wall biosynthesis